MPPDDLAARTSADVEDLLAPITFNKDVLNGLVDGMSEICARAVAPLVARLEAIEQGRVAPGSFDRARDDLEKIERWLTHREGFALLLADRAQRRVGGDASKSADVQSAETFYRTVAERLRVIARTALVQPGHETALARAALLLRAMMEHFNGGPVRVARSLRDAGINVPRATDG